MTLHNLDVAIALAVIMLAVSLLITIFTQMIAAIFKSRGATLRWGLETLFETIYPAGTPHARDIAEQVLTHKLISDSFLPQWFTRFKFLRRRRLATAIRLSELMGILQALTPHTAAAPTDKEEPSRAFILKQLAAGVPPAGSAPLDIDIPSWFNAAMDRASQRFATKMRVYTVVCSLLVAFALHLDTFRLLTQISADPQLRAGLVSASKAMEDQAAGLLTENQAESTAAANIHVPGIYRTTLDQLMARHTDAFEGASAPPRFASREDAAQWIRRNALAGSLDALVSEYQLGVDAGLSSREDRLLDRAASIKSSMDTAGFQLIPDPYHGWDFWPASKGWWPLDNLHFWGILFSAGLLSLGAPFWFNALKNLSSLRPILASKQEKEQQG